MIQPGDIVSYETMSQLEGFRPQKGMNFRRRRNNSVFLMSRRPSAPYTDRIEDGGRTLIYQGHDDHRTPDGPDPRTVDQPERKENGTLADNGKFLEAANAARRGAPPERVHVYEKLRTNVWVFNGAFNLTDAWQESDGNRTVFKFKLQMIDPSAPKATRPMAHNRVIPGAVKAEVWKRDHGKCTICGRADNLHFDHILPFSKGGTSVSPKNIQILCARHNLEKRDRIG